MERVSSVPSELDGAALVCTVVDRSSTLQKTNLAMEKHHFLIVGDTSSNGCFSIVVLVFGGVKVPSRFG